MNNKTLAALAVVVAAATGGAYILSANPAQPTTQPAQPVAKTDTATTDSPQLTGLIASHVLPDPTLTPGVANPDINQGNISQNICNPNWSTKSIRPPVSYTTPLKIKQIAQYGYSDTSTASYEEDHLISLEIGGSPTDPGNLWPEPYNVSVNGKLAGAHEKDKVENEIHSEVCAGNMTLVQAQTIIAHDWYDYYVSKGL